MLVNYINKYATGKVALASFCISMSIYLVMVLYSIPLVSSYAPGLMLFDVSPAGYTYEYALTLLNQLGAEGRNQYLSLQLPLDFVFPLTFGISHAFVISWLLKKVNITVYAASYSCLFPIIGCLFDYSENIAISSMLNNYPGFTESFVQLASSFTIAKSIITTITYLVICVLLIKAATSALKSRKAKASA